MMKKKSKHIEGIGWRYDLVISMQRRMYDHDYQGRSIYMLTLTTLNREPLLGELKWRGASAEDAYIEPTPLGREVIACWQGIPSFYPEVEVRDLVLMPDHIHGILFVTSEMETHLGHIVKGFKIGCTKAMWRLQDAAAQSGSASPSSSASLSSSASPSGAAASASASCAAPPSGAAAPSSASPSSAADFNSPKHPRPSLFSSGYQDSVLMGKDQLKHMIHYIADNPRRLAVKRMHPGLFRVVRDLEIHGRKYAAIGNRWLLDKPARLQVRCHNNTTPDNLLLIEKQKTYFLSRASRGAVIVSPCISAGEKAIAHAILDARLPLIVLLENGFPPLYKPSGQYFDACASGLLLMLAPWPYHADRRTITRQQCLALNEMSSELCTEPWTPQLEDALRKG